MSDEDWIGLIIVIVLLAAIGYIGWGISYATNPKTHFKNACETHRGIPDTHVDPWKCVGAEK